MYRKKPRKDRQIRKRTALKSTHWDLAGMFSKDVLDISRVIGRKLRLVACNEREDLRLYTLIFSYSISRARLRCGTSLHGSWRSVSKELRIRLALDGMSEKDVGILVEGRSSMSREQFHVKASAITAAIPIDLAIDVAIQLDSAINDIVRAYASTDTLPRPRKLKR